MRNLSKINEGADVVTKDYVDSSVSGGTVTSVGVSNATNGGLTVSGSPVTSSGTIIIGHSNVLSSAQTTQAVYPIKIDKNGHISAYGSAVTIPTVPSNIVNTITTTAGAHSAISNKTGSVSFNVPTKTSHLTNDSGFITNAGVTGVKGNTESSYRTGQVNLTPVNIGAVAKNETGNTQELRRPASLAGTNDVTLDAKINTLRANRLAFLPADQIIIEKTIDGGSTWTSANVSDTTKVQLFSEVLGHVALPLLNGKKSSLCGLRITFTGMKYNVPTNTAETSKYNYWNSNYVLSTERYCQLKEMYFWVSVSGGYMNVKVERATGANSTNWITIFDNPNFNMTGYDGNDYVSFSQSTFGGGTTQTSNYWNYRITFMTDDAIPSSPYDGYSQSVSEIRAYGDTAWTKPDNYMANDHLYSFDYQKNATFPAQITATQFNGALNGNAATSSLAVKARRLEGLDNRNTNQSPSWYITNYPFGLLHEFKTTSAIEVNNILTSFSYCDLITMVPYNDSSGGLPIQIAQNYSSQKRAIRYATSTTTWGPWKDMNNADTVNNHTVNSDVPANAKFTDTVPTTTQSKVTGITASTTATKTTLGTAFTIPNVTSAGSASTWAFEEVSIPNVTAAGSASTWAFEDIACDDITSWSAGSGSASISGAVDSSDSSQLNITISHTHTAPTLQYTARTVSSKKSGANSTAPTLGTAIKVQSKKSGANGSAPTLGTAFTVPNVTGNTSATVSVTDPGHTHSI